MNIKYFLGCILFITACNQAKEAKMESTAAIESMAIADSAYQVNEETSSLSSKAVSSSAAVEKNSDPNRKFIRTADLRFRAKNTVKTTYDIENITVSHGGFVTSTELRSQIEDVHTAPISSDSSLETTKFTVVNNMTIRVPNTQLDSTLKDIARNIEYLDYRTIQAEDVALQILSNNMTQNRIDKNESRLTRAIEQRGRKLGETTDAEELLIEKQEQADQAKINNLSLKDRVAYSTIQLSIYQRAEIKCEKIPNERMSQRYEPNIFIKIWESIKDGWRIIEFIIVWLFKLWAIIAAGCGGYYLYRRFLKKK